MGYRVPTAMGMLLLFLLGAGCEKAKPNADHAADAVKVKAVRLGRQTFLREIQVQGVIQPVDRATVAARVAGVIDALNVREGDRVKKGDILFQTDRKNLENQVLVAKENRKVAEETCQTVREDIKIAEITLTKARIDYDRACRLRERHAVSESSASSICNRMRPLMCRRNPCRAKPTRTSKISSTCRPKRRLSRCSSELSINTKISLPNLLNGLKAISRKGLQYSLLLNLRMRGESSAQQIWWNFRIRS